MAVDAYTKWVEVGIADGPYTSLWVANWVHLNITCRYGVPAVVRCDRGTEFRGDFQKYCHAFGIQVALISTAHPRANGLVERYNACIKAGFRRMATVCPDGKWFEFLPEILTGLRMLPSRSGYSPYQLVYKCSPHFPFLQGHVVSADLPWPSDEEQQTLVE